MSTALYGVGGLRFWSEEEIELREAFQGSLVRAVRRALLGVNMGWKFERCEGPTLTPRGQVSPAYSEDDLFVTNHSAAEQQWVLRAETTPSSYAVLRDRWRGSNKVLPYCVWQAGKSYRREQNDGASPAKLRFNEFWQLEMQCAYRADSGADYAAAVVPVVEKEIALFVGCETRVVPSDRLPAYSMLTLDVEAMHRLPGQWREMCSISKRTDFAEGVLVLEVAVGLDRVTTLAMEARQ